MESEKRITMELKKTNINTVFDWNVIKSCRSSEMFRDNVLHTSAGSDK
jgi:hypothetical protein